MNHFCFTKIGRSRIIKFKSNYDSRTLLTRNRNSIRRMTSKKSSENETDWCAEIWIDSNQFENKNIYFYILIYFYGKKNNLIQKITRQKSDLSDMQPLLYNSTRRNRKMWYPQKPRWRTVSFGIWESTMSTYRSDRKKTTLSFFSMKHDILFWDSWM